MNDLATIDEQQTLTLVRDLPGPIERVWAFLTDPKFLTRWLSPGTIASHVGGAVQFELGVQGRVTAYQPPHVLEYTWSEPELERGAILDTLVRWELTDKGDHVRLTLTHSRLSAPEAIAHGAGWHAFLDRLRSVLDGSEPVDLMQRFVELQGEYAQYFSVDRQK